MFSKLEMQVGNNNEYIYTEPLVSIIILNWNGYEDTVECLQSISKCYYNNFEVVLVDNASADGSVKKIRQWIKTESFKNILIIENSENYGFAKGCNIGIDVALKNKCDYVLLLNNDTVVREDFLNKLIEFFNDHPEYPLATPQIRYYDRQEIIWNCGGRLTRYGSRKYFYEDKNISELPKTEFKNISFVTGCAMMVKADTIRNKGMLSEDFFFGEEDFEFSLRMKKNKIKAACALKSVVFHKVNSSISRTSDFVIGKLYIYYLNRFINLKNYMPLLKWRLWRYFYRIYISSLLRKRYKIPVQTVRKFLRLLMQDSASYRCVSKVTFDKYINFDFS